MKGGSYGQMGSTAYEAVAQKELIDKIKRWNRLMAGEWGKAALCEEYGDGISRREAFRSCMEDLPGIGYPQKPPFFDDMSEVDQGIWDRGYERWQSKGERRLDGSSRGLYRNADDPFWAPPPVAAFSPEPESDTGMPNVLGLSLPEPSLEGEFHRQVCCALDEAIADGLRSRHSSSPDRGD